jgi:hypothetical protein
LEVDGTHPVLGLGIGRSYSAPMEVASIVSKLAVLFGVNFKTYSYLYDRSPKPD